MIAVLFELEPAAGRREDYLDHAADLRALVEGIEGFISAERFQSLADPDRILSLSFFEDERSVQRWRETTQHRRAQHLGRSGLFRDYRLRIAEVIRDYSMTDRAQAPEDSRSYHVAPPGNNDRWGA